MAKTKNLEMYLRAENLYRLHVLVTDEKREEFKKLTNEEKEKRVNSFKSRNKALFVGDSLSILDLLSSRELNKLKNDLQNYIKEIDVAVENYNQREIKEIENQIAILQKAHDNEIKKLNKKIEKIKNKKEETKNEENKKEENK